MIERARTGDPAAITVLWRIYQPQVLRVLRAKRTPDADDVASQVWIDVGRALDRFVGDGADFRRWIFTIASRRSVDAFRTASRTATDVLDRLDDTVTAPAADDVFEADGALDRALEIISQLSPGTAEAVMLRVVYGLPVKEVAEIMDREDGTVRVLVHRGLRRLRELLGVPDEDAPTDVTPSPLETLI